VRACGRELQLSTLSFGCVTANKKDAVRGRGARRWLYVVDVGDAVVVVVVVVVVDAVLLVNVVLSHSLPVEAAVENAMWVFSVVLAWCTREGGSERSERPFPVLLVRLPRLSAQGRENEREKRLNVLRIEGRPIIGFYMVLH
jgi:hypothetical protein